MLLNEIIELVFARVHSSDLDVLLCTSRKFRIITQKQVAMRRSLASSVFDTLCCEFKNKTQPTGRTFPSVSINLRAKRADRIDVDVTMSRYRKDLIVINPGDNRIEHFSDDFVFIGLQLPIDLSSYIHQACLSPAGGTNGPTPAWRSQLPRRTIVAHGSVVGPPA